MINEADNGSRSGLASFHVSVVCMLLMTLNCSSSDRKLCLHQRGHYI